MIDIVKASAGSGKTYTLSGKYISLLMANPDEFAYRHILAVTFTNKATDEMKSRILKDLYELSHSNNPNAAKAGRVLCNILHDYGAFSVSTIDKFFQQTLRSFAREIGQAASYQVELDKKQLVEEAVETILDSLNEDDSADKDMIEFILENMMDKLAEGGRPDIAGELKEMGVQLRSESFRDKLADLGQTIEESYSGEELKKIKVLSSGIISSFEKKTKEFAEKILNTSISAGVQPDDYYRSWIQWLEKLRDQELKSVLDRFLISSFWKYVDDRNSWFSKKNAWMNAQCDEVENQLIQFKSFWDKGLPVYRTALVLRKQVYGLGVAVRLDEAFRNIVKERNVVCLDESNTILRNIIDGSDTPFVYEKTGTRYDNFLLDEFQDTSTSQWENFKPLLEESESKGGDNLVVGDVKQSIYRWRDSDWNLLDSGIKNSFPTSTERSLQNNWRSLGEIISFNNDFYPAVTNMLDSTWNGSSSFKKLSDMYSDVQQTPGKPQKQNGGRVRVKFCPGEEEELDAMVQAVDEAIHEQNAKPGDIAVLVRTNDNGTDVAQKLIENGFEVVTEASLSVKNSISVRRLVSLMSYVDNPADSINCHQAVEMGLDNIPVSYHGLVDLCEELLGVLQGNEKYKEDCANEVMYLQSFVDYLMDYSASKGNNLRDFLKYWAGVDPKISSSLSGNSVKVLTIHKSKGLDFPFVIVPFAENIELFHNSSKIWCAPEGKGTELEPVSDKLYRVPLSDKSNQTLFADTYQQELHSQWIDGVNTMYVATTRASKEMLILAKTPKEEKKEKKLGNFADILFEYCSGSDLDRGEAFDFNNMERKVEVLSSYGTTYPVYPLEGKLKVRPFASDYFSRDNSILGKIPSFEELSYREKGIVLHDILAHVEKPEDLKSSVLEAVASGDLREDSAPGVERFLSARIRQHPEFFPTDGTRILSETEIIGWDGDTSSPDDYIHRPDRVLCRPDGSVLIVDYKFGHMRDDYEKQINSYRYLFEAMGYSPVKACLWFVYKNEVIFL